MDFKEQYRHPKWQKKRLDILKRDKFTCRSCGDKESTLNVHHRYYDKNKLLWEYKNDDLFTMCNDCHKYWHEELIGIKKVLPKNIDALLETKRLIKLINKLSPPEIHHINDMVRLIIKNKI